MRKIMVILFLTSFFFIPDSAAQELTADEILSRRDANMVFHTAQSEIDMNITIGKRTITKKMISFSKGEEKSFIEFLSPARDRGTKMLKIGKVLKIYFPSAERVMRLSGHMLKQSMMGSDFSYEDLTETSEELKKNYSVTLQQEESINNTPCYVIQLESKLENKTYFFQKVWIDKQKFIGLKAEFSSKSGKLLKVLFVEEIQSYKNRFYPVKITMEDKLRNNSKTEMIIKKINFNIDIPDEVFTERNLKRKTQ